jgi:hypothetical protein
MTWRSVFVFNHTVTWFQVARSPCRHYGTCTRCTLNVYTVYTGSVNWFSDTETVNTSGSSGARVSCALQYMLMHTHTCAHIHMHACAHTCALAPAPSPSLSLSRSLSLSLSICAGIVRGGQVLSTKSQRGTLCGVSIFRNYFAQQFRHTLHSKHSKLAVPRGNRVRGRTGEGRGYVGSVRTWDLVSV